MRIGEMLVQDGIITAEQLDAALQTQVVHGARLGTNLVELGLLDLDTLTRALSRQLGVGAALEEHFRVVVPSTAALLPARTAQRHLAIPIVPARKPGEQFIVAFQNPHDLRAIDEVAFALGATVKPLVAAELRVHYNLERFYKIQRPNRFLRVDATAQRPADTAPQRSDDRRRYVEPNPAPAKEPAAPSRPLIAAATPAPAPTPAPTSAPLVAAPAPTEAPQPAPVALPPAVDPAPTEDPGEAPRPPLTAEEALDRLGEASTRDEIGDAVADYLRSAYGCGLVLIVREGMALGWKGFAPGVDRDVIESVAVPLNAASVFATAFESHKLLRTGVGVEGAQLHGRLWKLLKSPAPTEVLVAPVVLRERVVNLVYTHAPPGAALSAHADHELAAACAAASAAYTRTIQSAKKAAPQDDPGPRKKRGWKAPT